MEEWIRWGILIVWGAAQLVVAWLGDKLYKATDRIAKLETQVALLQDKHHIDPIEYTKALTGITTAIEHLAEKLVENDTRRNEQIAAINVDLDEIRRDVKVLLGEKAKGRGQ